MLPCAAVLPRVLYVQAKRVEEALQFMKACGMHDEMGVMNETEFYTSHECLLLDYEEALTRLDSTTNQWCAILTPSAPPSTW